MTCCFFPAAIFCACSPPVGSGWKPAAGRYFLLSTASLSALGYEHNLSEPVIRLMERYSSCGNVSRCGYEYVTRPSSGERSTGVAHSNLDRKFNFREEYFDESRDAGNFDSPNTGRDPMIYRISSSNTAAGRFSSPERTMHSMSATLSLTMSWKLTTIGARERFEAFARSVRDILSQRWVHTEKTYERANPKRVYYLSMEFLIGRSLANNVTNLLLDPVAKEAVKQEKLDWFELLEQEPDAGLGNGGLGRLAACFLDSMATMQIPAMGYGLRYEYGIFKQTIQDGWQREVPDNWLRRPDPWEVVASV